MADPTFYELVDGKLDSLQCAAILAIGNMKGDRSGIEPSDFFGMSENVTAVMESGIEGMKKLLLEQWYIKWDGKSSLWKTIIDECRERCASSRAYAYLSVDSNRLEAAIKVLRNQQANGSVPLATVEKARGIVKAAYDHAMRNGKAEIIPAEVPEAAPEVAV